MWFIEFIKDCWYVHQLNNIVSDVQKLEKEINSPSKNSEKLLYKGKEE